MKTFNTLIRTIPILLLAILIGCSRSDVTKAPFVHRNAVFHAKAGGDTAVSSVEKNFSMDEKGQRQEYSGSMSLQQGAIEIRHEFVGTAFCPASPNGEEWHDADVYVVAITGERTPAETIPVIYRGQQTVVVQRADLQIILKEGDTEPAIAADGVSRR